MRREYIEPDENPKKAVCNNCGIETNELYENVTKISVKWVCRKCRDFRYGRYDYKSRNTKDRVPPHG